MHSIFKEVIYLTDWSLDLKYGRSYYEFEETYSILQNYDSMGAGITKYFSNKAVKTQLMANYINFPIILLQIDLILSVYYKLFFSIYLKFSVIKLATF